MSGFRAFLKEYGVIGLALGVIIGGKASELVKAVADGVLMPIVGLALPSGDWQKWEIVLVKDATGIKVGEVLAALLNFIIVALFVYVVSKKLLKEETVAKK